MNPTPRDWLGAGLLALVLVVMTVALVAAALGSTGDGGAAIRALAAG
jgi:hypothetical protein